MTKLNNRYELGDRIGGGGMADVFRAKTIGAEGFSKAVAIKQIKKNISKDRGFGELFIKEARLAAKLLHPNIVQTIDFERDEQGCFYLVMELIEGIDLRRLYSSGALPISVTIFIVSEVMRALDYSHEMVADGHSITIVHRDISPHNIMLGWQGSVKVVDFGIAKAIEGSSVSRSGSLKGKVSYMSPEQVHGKELDGRSDIFALGIILHELLRGERLFVAESEAATLSMLLTKPIPSPRTKYNELSDDLERVVMKMLARDREERYLSAKDALDALTGCSMASNKGRSDLEIVLRERFPENVPQRVRRISQTPMQAFKRMQTAVTETQRVVGTDLGTAQDDTIVSDAEDLFPAKAFGKKGVPVPPRTATAFPAQQPLHAQPRKKQIAEKEKPFSPQSAETTAKVGTPTSKPTMHKVLLLGGIVVALAGFFAYYFLYSTQTNSSSSAHENQSGQIEVINVIEGDEKEPPSKTVGPSP